MFSLNDRRRMLDVEFISSLLLFLRRGIESEIDQTSINQVYDMFNEQYDEAADDKIVIERILKEIERIEKSDTTNSFAKIISKQTHFYSIFVSLYRFVVDDGELTREQTQNLLDFFASYEKNEGSLASEYKVLVKEGTRSKQSRMKRMKILQDVIEGKTK